MAKNAVPSKRYVLAGKNYTINSKHRNGVPKSDCTQWIVSEKEETDFFCGSVSKSLQCAKNNYWWVEFDASNKKLKIIGKTDAKYAFIAKFVADNNNLWHGYPVTAERSPYDVPPTNVLNYWREQSHLSKQEVCDIKRGRGYAKNIV
ncbi:MULTISPECIES: hypothetical protein [Lonsdalea]|uniref:hypothetical protein n=1 Tax=Lonsdalea TaxID=1082702 RepID=UPI0011BE85D6|nr:MULTISPECIES: hypothetical protein [Lonsdalea]